MIDFGDTPEALRSRLSGSFPRAELQSGDPDFQEMVSRVLAFLEKPARGLDLPLDIQGTAFQRRVWEITRNIPRGHTMTYGEIARRAGSPGAARAVGQAMAHNPWPVIVPCHRVVGHDGRLTGFGGGMAMKQRMLEMEGALLIAERPQT